MYCKKVLSDSGSKGKSILIFKGDINSTLGSAFTADRNGIFTWARRQYLRSLTAKGEVQTQVRKCRSDREVKKGV